MPIRQRARDPRNDAGSLAIIDATFKQMVLGPTRPLTTRLGALLMAAVAVLIPAQILVNWVPSWAESEPPSAGAAILVLVISMAYFTAPFVIVAVAAWRGRRWARVGATVLSVVALWVASGLVPGVVIAAAMIVSSTILLWRADARVYARDVWAARHP